MELVRYIVSMFILRKRHERFSKYFSMVGSLCFCNNVDNLFEELGIVHDPKEWRLFTVLPEV